MLVLVAVGGIAVGVIASGLLDDDGATTAIDDCLERFSGPNDVSVYLRPDATESQIQAIEDHLEEDDRVASMDFVDKDETYVEFVRLFATSPGLIRTVDPDALPPSFRVTLDDLDDLEEFRDDLSGRPAVYEVISSEDVELSPGLSSTTEPCSPSD